jgi:hypothetical protein
MQLTTSYHLFDHDRKVLVDGSGLIAEDMPYSGCG